MRAGGRELTGQRFGDWLVLGEAEKRGAKRMWSCQCQCGKVKAVYETHLLRGMSNGCNRGHAPRGPTRNSWNAMHERCYRVRHVAYHRYGGRGIKVCERWHDFSAFLEDMGPRPDGASLDRLDNDRDYEPGNCRWATPREQGNNRATNRLVDVGGQQMTIADAARALGLKYQTASSRVYRTGRL